MKDIDKKEEIIAIDKKESNKKVISAVIAGVIILGIFIIYWQRNIRINKINSELNNEEVSNDYKENGNNCFDRTNYLVITRPDVSGNAGDDILVKYKMNKFQKIDCNYIAEDDDFELLNTSVGDGPAVYNSQYFAFIKDNLMIIDEGTGTSRSFKIYDLTKEEQIFNDSYTAGLFNLNGSILTYWHKTNDVPNKENCSKVDEYTSMGGAKIEGKVTLDITNIESKKYNEFRCSYAE